MGIGDLHWRGSTNQKCTCRAWNQKVAPWPMAMKSWQPPQINAIIESNRKIQLLETFLFSFPFFIIIVGYFDLKLDLIFPPRAFNFKDGDSGPNPRPTMNIDSDIISNTIIEFPFDRGMPPRGWVFVLILLFWVWDNSLTRYFFLKLYTLSTQFFFFL